MNRPGLAWSIVAAALGLAFVAAPSILAQPATNPPPPQHPAEKPLPGALPPGLYRAGAVPLPPPAFYNPDLYYFSGYGPYGSPGYAYGVVRGPFTSTGELERRARIPYRTALRDAQDYHYLNLVIQRDELLRRRSVELADDGRSLFRAGRYDRAAMALLGSSEADHGNAVSRIRAGHALFALGRYEDAVRLIRRAFELQPALATIAYDVRDDYGRAGDFRRHLASLESHVQANPGDAAGMTMLAYVRYVTEGPSAAYELLRAADRLDPANELIDKLLAISSQLGPPPKRAKPLVAEPTDAPPGAAGTIQRVSIRG